VCLFFPLKGRPHLDNSWGPVRIGAVIQLFCFIFFLSGASALIFESLWFQLTGLSLGNSTWAISIVLASFMGGLSLGEGFVAFQGHRIKRPIRFYAFLELIIGLSGCLLVLVLPHLSKILVPLFRGLQDQAILLNILRGTIAFIIMVIPTTAMGATFPVLGKAAAARDPNFGKILGWLYGCNTLGAVVGVCASEVVLIKWLGLSGAGTIAASCNILAAVVALRLSQGEREADASGVPEPAPVMKDMSAQTWRLLAASCLSGFVFLALEVVWFRFLELFFLSTSLNFAILLAVVLTGISSGGLLAGYWFLKKPNASALIVPLVCLNGLLISLLYGNFRGVIVAVTQQVPSVKTMLASTVFLVLPVAVLSGTIFTVLGRILHDRFASGTRTIGFLTLANTLGSVFGSLFAGLVFLPLLGMERTFFLLALTYGVVVWLVFDGNELAGSIKKAVIYAGIIGAYGVSLVFFPFGLMNNFYTVFPFVRASDHGEQRVAIKEGTNETIQYFRKDLLGQPYYYRLVTNHYSMSATTFEARRYMSFFAYWPMAVHPGIHDALLICYGVGVTAKALTRIPGIQHIDIVDISRDVLQLSPIVYPDPKTNPVFDPRVKTHIEDGRFFLLSMKKTYDLITGEPPPPMCKGVVNLYTREYFQLVYDRLSPNGIATYWLPIQQLTPTEAKAITKGFCQVFNNCSLWASSEDQWMLAGIKDPVREVPYNGFVRVWDDPELGAELRDLGFVNPQQFGSLFIADGERLRAWVKDVPALTDNYPKILESKYAVEPGVGPQFVAFMDPELSLRDFLASRQISRIWPAKLRQETEEYFPARDWVLKIMGVWKNGNKVSPDERLHYLRDPLLKPFFVFALGSDPYTQRVSAQAKERQGPAYAKVESERLRHDKMFQEVQRLYQLIPGLPKVIEFEE
jgi:spermidine synthase